MSQPLRVSGDLRDVDSALLIRSLCRSRETGRLAVSDAELSRSLTFRGGEILLATSNDPDEGLGACLVRSGLLGLEELGRLEGKVTSSQPLAAILVDLGLLAPDQLVAAVTAQLRGIFEAVVLAERGRYWFDFGEPAVKELITLRADSRGLLLAALRRVTSVVRVRRGLAGLIGRRWQRALPEALAALELAREEELLLEALAEGWDGGQVPAIAGLSAWQCARSLWALQIVGALVPISPRRATPRPLAGAPPSMAIPIAAEESHGDPEIDDAIREFNDRQQRLYRHLRVEIGAAAEPFVRAAVNGLDAATRQLFDQVDFLPLGRFQAGPLGERLGASGGAGARVALAQLIQAELEALRRTLGEERAAAIAEALAAGPGPGGRDGV